MQKIFLLFIFMILAGGCLKAQTLSGTVTDSATHKPIEGASVYITQLKRGSVTDAKGRYHINGLPKGSYDVTLGIVGYGQVTKQVTINGDAGVDFAPAVTPETLSDVVITSLGVKTSLRRAP